MALTLQTPTLGHNMWKNTISSETSRTQDTLLHPHSRQVEKCFTKLRSLEINSCLKTAMNLSNVFKQTRVIIRTAAMK